MGIFAAGIGVALAIKAGIVGVAYKVHKDSKDPKKDEIKDNSKAEQDHFNRKPRKEFKQSGE